VSRGKWLASRLGGFIRRKRARGTQWIGLLEGLESLVDEEEFLALSGIPSVAAEVFQNYEYLQDWQLRRRALR
jgi:hypothetical protein